MPHDSYSKTVLSHAQKFPLEPFLGKIYSKYRSVNNRKEVYELMSRGRAPYEVILENFRENLKTTSETKRFTESLRNDRRPQSRVQLTYSSFNRLVFTFKTNQPVFFGLSHPYSNHWHAIVNGIPQKIYRANGAAIATQIPKGAGSVEFYYRSPASVYGMLLTCISLVLVAGLILRAEPNISARSKYRFLLALTICVSVFYTYWYTSLYSGKNLETHYTWVSAPSGTPHNWAYSKLTLMSSIWAAPYPDLFGSGRAVDGDKTSSGFLTALQNNPWWLVDLHQCITLESIIIYEGDKKNKRPLCIRVSKDGNHWSTVECLDQSLHQDPIKLDLTNASNDQKKNARYVLVQSLGRTTLELNEVEVYGTF